MNIQLLIYVDKCRNTVVYVHVYNIHTEPSVTMAMELEI